LLQTQEEEEIERVGTKKDDTLALKGIGAGTYVCQHTIKKKKRQPTSNSRKGEKQREKTLKT